MTNPARLASAPHGPWPPRPSELTAVAAAPCWVRILTAIVLVVEQPFAVIVEGLKTTDELAGSPAAEKAMVPV